MTDDEFDRLLAEYEERRRRIMAAKKRKVDWPQVAALGVVTAGVIAALVLVDPAKAEAWLALGPGIVGVLTTLYAASRGRALPKDGES